MASLDPASSSRQELLYLFAQFGELRELREDPLRPNCCLVEYYDTRHAGGWVGGWLVFGGPVRGLVRAGMTSIQYFVN